jgi:hypothetical protein
MQLRIEKKVRVILYAVEPPKSSEQNCGNIQIHPAFLIDNSEPDQISQVGFPSRAFGVIFNRKELLVIIR